MRKRVYKAIKRGDAVMHGEKHTGRGEDRRKDKLEAARLGIPQWLRRYTDRFSRGGA